MRETPGQSQSVQTTHSPFPRKYIETAAHLSDLWTKFGIIHLVCITCLSSTCDIWSKVQSITLTFNSPEIDDLPPVWRFYLVLMPSLFFFFVIPDSSSLRSDIANYFKLSGRQFSISIKSRLLPPTLGRGNGGLCSQPRNSYGCHLRRNLNSIFSPTSEDTR